MTALNPASNLQSLKVTCETCSLAELCLPRGLNKEETKQLDEIVKRRRPVQKNEHLYRINDEDKSLYMVRSGSFKTYLSTDDGDEQVVGFHLPGELMGLDAFENERHGCAAVALETSTVCELPGEKLDMVCQKVPGLHRQIQRLIGKEISSEHGILLLLGKKAAEERLAAFLLSLSSRYQVRGYSATEFNLSMPRQDIGNYLSLAVETISRLLAKFQEQGLISVDRRLIKICDLPKLKSIVGSCVGGSSNQS